MNRRMKIAAMTAAALWLLPLPIGATALMSVAQKKADVGSESPYTDKEILQRIYDKSYKTPKGFYDDPSLKGIKYSLYFQQPGWFADSKKKARNIVEKFLAKPSNIKGRKIEQERTTDKFFDFRAGRIWYRIHNPKYFKPKGPRIDSALPSYDGGKTKSSSYIGMLKVRPLTPQVVKELAEYLWLIRYYNLGGAKVLHSSAEKEDGKIVATLYTTLVVYGDFGLSDQITVNRITYIVDAKSGTVIRNQKTIKKLTGKKN